MKPDLLLRCPLPADGGIELGDVCRYLGTHMKLLGPLARRALPEARERWDGSKWRLAPLTEEEASKVLERYYFEEEARLRSRGLAREKERARRSR
jgi:hypothetical protein